MTLKEAGEQLGLLMGTAVMAKHLDGDLGELVAREFSVLTGENEFKPGRVHPAVGAWDFAGADKIAAFAERRGIKLVGHTLLWHQQGAGFLFEDGGKSVTREVGLRNLRDHIEVVAGRYSGRVLGWDVVNEAVSDDAGVYLRPTPALSAIGQDYIVRAFEMAAAADPGAELYYNDYSNEGVEKREKCIDVIREIKKAGLRIDAVGMQCHLLLAEPSAELIEEAISAYAAEGVKIVVTELDVDVLPRKAAGGADLSKKEMAGQNPYVAGLPGEVEEALAQRYAEVFEVFRKHREHVSRVTLWGTHDGMSWLNYWPVAGRVNYPLLFDRGLAKKKAYAAVMDVLRGA